MIFQVPIEDIIEEEKSSRKSPPESDKEKTRDRDVSLSMAPLPIPLGPLGGFAGTLQAFQRISPFTSRPLNEPPLYHKVYKVPTKFLFQNQPKTYPLINKLTTVTVKQWNVTKK